MTDFLIELNDEKVGHEPLGLDLSEYRLREAAKAVIFNDEGKIALLFVGKDNYHKLPGGGIEEGEALEEAMLREMKEEVGANISMREGFLAKTLEYRDQKKLKQISYCCIADLDGELFEMDRTDTEIELEQAPIWVTIDEAIELIENDVSEYYGSKFVKMRELAFLEAVKEFLGE